MMNLSDKELKERIYGGFKQANDCLLDACLLMKTWGLDMFNQKTVPEEFLDCLQAYANMSENFKDLSKLVNEAFCDEANLPEWAKPKGEIQVKERPNVKTATLETYDNLLKSYMPYGVLVKSKVEDGKVVSTVFENTRKSKSHYIQDNFKGVEKVQFDEDFFKVYRTTYEEQMIKYKDRVSSSSITIKYMVIEADQNDSFKEWVKDQIKNLYQAYSGEQIDSVILKFE